MNASSEPMLADEGQLIQSLVRQFAWSKIPSSQNDPCLRYRLAVELLDGRKFWRFLTNRGTPDEYMRRGTVFYGPSNALV